MLQRGQDSALLRFGLGQQYFKSGHWEAAVEQLAAALRQDPSYSAAWKLYGRALLQAGRGAEAVAALEQGITVAEGRGDIQAAREMRVFLKRARAAVEGPLPQ
jgi:predicted Zn-dependent protease